MNAKARKILRIIVCFATVFLALSCRPVDLHGYDEVRFLWFIPVSEEGTCMTCLTELVIFGLCLAAPFFADRIGWHSAERQRAIRNKDQEIIGYVDTGEVDHWYVSEEEHEKQKSQYKFIALCVRKVMLIVLTWGFVISWVFPAPSTWFIVFWLPICGYRLYHAYKHFDDDDLLMLWEKVFVVICLICAIVYR